MKMLISSAAALVWPKSAASVTGSTTSGPGGILQAFEFQVMCAVKLLGASAYSAEIARNLSVKLGRHVSLAQVFVALERLEDKGLVASDYETPGRVRGGRRRRVFLVKATGERVLRDTLAAYTQSASALGVENGKKEKKVAPAT